MLKDIATAYERSFPMKVGFDGNHTFGFRSRGVFKTLDLAKELKMDGVFYKTLLDISPSFDQGEIKDVKAYAEGLGLYLDVGVGRVNPYNTAEAPEIRILGEGDYRLAMERMVRSARSIGCTELWADTATSSGKEAYSGKFRIDRFRTDVSWNDQLAATEKFLKSLAPILREMGSRIDVETHEEITSYEVVHLVESVGPDVVGITLDTGNVIVRCEDPVAAARRVAPYTHLTHLRDSGLFLEKDGLKQYIYPCGKGVINWNVILTTLGKYSPDLHLSLEDFMGAGTIGIFDPDFLERHPELQLSELIELVHLAKIHESKVSVGELPDPKTYWDVPFADQWINRLSESAKYFRGILETIN
jgi:sugar phosphate isomerase/epimerase